MGKFIDHPIKKVIREFWCKPIIKYVHEIFNHKLIYLGLPGIEALDLKAWLDYIDYIIAIDCGHYKKDQFDINFAREEIKKLNDYLNDLERKDIISGYSLYLGFIEEVVLKGIDKNGRSFSQNEFVQVYNLDFCNSLTVPLKIVDLDGNVNHYYKNEVLRKLLEVQRDLNSSKSSTKFLMFITIHSKFWEDEAEKYFQDGSDAFYNTYLESIKKIEKKERINRLLRYYFFDILKRHFTACGFIPEFFPVVLYEGVGFNNNLMCFTVAGTYYKSASASAPFYQKIEELVSQKFLSADRNEIILINNNFEEDTETNPITHFESFKSIREIWIKN